MQDKIIIACDFKTQQELETFLEPFGDQKLFLKIGMELYYREGRKLVQSLKQQGHKIFLDLKLHDIPNTVKNAILNLRDLDVDFMTIHAQGGREMMKAACDAVEGTNTKLLAVTVLTSLDDIMLHKDLNQSLSAQAYANHLAALAQEAGVHGCICSPLEVSTIKSNSADTFLCVTPGIRLAEDSLNDQKRVLTPEKAVAAGSDYMVIGRSITASTNPYEVYQLIGGASYE